MSNTPNKAASVPKSEDKYWRRHGARYRARRRAVDILFEAEARDLDPVSMVEDRVQMARDPEIPVAPVAEYTRQIISGAASELDGIDENIERYLATDWELNRLPAVDRAILRVAVWEILHNPDVDAAVAVVEGVELASQYSNDVAAPYIHAVLDDVAQFHAAHNPLTQAADAEESVDPVDSVDPVNLVEPTLIADPDADPEDTPVQD